MTLTVDRNLGNYLGSIGETLLLGYVEGLHLKRISSPFTPMVMSSCKKKNSEDIIQITHMQP
jgi:hypothetical protein